MPPPRRGGTKQSNIRGMEHSGGKKKQGEPEKVFKEIMAGNFPNLAKYINLQVQETEQTPNRKNSKSPTPKRITTRLQKTKDDAKIFKPRREKGFLTQGKNSLDGRGLLNRNRGNQRGVDGTSQAEIPELSSTPNSISYKIIL